jgi:hypothetical protein
MTTDTSERGLERLICTALQLPDADAEIEPLPTTGGGYRPESRASSRTNCFVGLRGVTYRGKGDGVKFLEEDRHGNLHHAMQLH